ncbi:hypothetical protein CONLIGDRAFT_713235 [Coniochaeta ligniaria NRRL 30616]|uniref:Phosphatidylinositol transfer protein SFH5 n=1 Tax=Coniochaeta ligniaria NRRL 30616 TaxID=1408157 RepID=A0A1J7ITY7_9PEZI|nr:hypothetical protein CONLIGDRAFT_713235 [Coniochaeta ligniaria NRRL 30616]
MDGRRPKWFPSFTSPQDHFLVPTRQELREQEERLRSSKGKQPEHAAPSHSRGTPQDGPAKSQTSPYGRDAISGIWGFLWGSGAKDDIELSAEHQTTRRLVDEEQGNALSSVPENSVPENQPYRRKSKKEPLLPTRENHELVYRTASIENSPPKVTSLRASRVVPSIPIPVDKLNKLQKACHKVMQELDYNEMWGVHLVGDNRNHIPTRLILAKFLQANSGETFEALIQLRAALMWRKKTTPRKHMTTIFDAKMFAGLGYIHDFQSIDGRAVAVFTMFGHANKELLTNIYGLDKFLTWRVALLERAIDHLKLMSAKELGSWKVADSYKLIQVVDLTGLHRAYWRF